MMNVDMQARNFLLTGPLMRELYKRIANPLFKRHERILRVSVRLGDVNGPKGGRDKYCRINVEIPGQNNVFIENTESNIYSAIYKAAERAIHTVSRRVARDRKRPIRNMHRHTGV